MKKINVIEGKEMKKSIITIVSVLLMVIAYGCSSGGGNNSNNSTPPLVTQVTRDTLVSFIRHYGKLNVLKTTLRQEIIINDTSKIKKFLGDAYPLWLDKYTNRILKVPYEVNVEIGFDLGEIALSVKEKGEKEFTVAKPTPIVEITGILIRFDQEYRDIGLTRWNITDAEFNAAWQSANVPELIKTQIAKERKDEFLDVVLAQTISEILSSVRNRYQDIDFKFEPAEKEPTFNEIPNPKIEKNE